MPQKKLRKNKIFSSSDGDAALKSTIGCGGGGISWRTGPPKKCFHGGRGFQKGKNFCGNNNINCTHVWWHTGNSPKRQTKQELSDSVLFETKQNKTELSKHSTHKKDIQDGFLLDVPRRSQGPGSGRFGSNAAAAAATRVGAGGAGQGGKVYKEDKLKVP